MPLRALFRMLLVFSPGTLFWALMPGGPAGTPFAQATPDRLSVAFSDPGKPGRLEAYLLQGSILVEGHALETVEVEASAVSSPSGADPTALDLFRSGLSLKEKNNVVTVSARSHQRPIDLIIRVPPRTQLALGTVRKGSVTVRGIEGAVRVRTVDGTIRFPEIGGATTAYALNGLIEATFRGNGSDAKVSLTSMRGKILARLASDLRADFLIRTSRGQVHCDFPLENPQSEIEDDRPRGGSLQARLKQPVEGKINGGGRELSFHTLDGEIRILQADP